MTWKKPLAGAVGWAFGLCVTILFVSLWGRAVVIDTDSLAESVSPLARSELVAGTLTEWLIEQLAEAGLDPALSDPVTGYVEESPVVASALESVVTDIVYAAASQDPDAASVDVGASLAPVVPKIAADLGAQGVPVSESAMDRLIANLDPLNVRDAQAAPVVGAGSPTASRLGVAALLAALGITVLGWAQIALEDDPAKTLRALLTKIALSGLSFAVFLRVGSWALDPSGGRAPVRESLSNLARSQWMVPLEVALYAGLAAMVIFVLRRIFKRGAGTQAPDESPTATGELQTLQQVPR